MGTSILTSSDGNHCIGSDPDIAAGWLNAVLSSRRTDQMLNRHPGARIEVGARR